MVRQTPPAVAHVEVNVVQPELAHRAPGRAGEICVALDRVHLAAEQREQCGVVTRPGADIQHAVGRQELQQLQHAGDHQRLRDRLVARDRKRHVCIRAVAQTGLDESLARDRGDRGQDTEVADRGS